MALVAMYYFSSKAIEKFTDENGGVEVGEQQPEESLNETQEERQLEVNPQNPASFWKNILALTQRKKESFDSIYDVE